jgi:tetratricopeptide (TPR) repeat protein
MKDFFISYNSADRQWAEWIAWQLEEAGYTTVLQAWDFRPGSNFVLEMQRAAAEAERTIAVLSPDYLSARFTHPEWTAAFAQDPMGDKGTLLPVRVRECDLKGLLPQIIYVDLVGLDEDEARGALLAGVRRERAKPTAPPGFPGVIPRSVPQRPRFPGALPPTWNIPHLRNPNFTGRESLLTQLRTALTSGQPAALTQAISGLGGVGKTQLAVEYAYCYVAEYDVVWWVRAEEPATLAADYAGLAGPLDLPQKDEPDQRVVVEAVRRWLGQNAGWLLVFDNAPGPAQVRDYLPQAATGHVLVTSRNPAWRGVASPLTVQVLERPESVDFLLKRTGQADEEAADALADALGDLPLALEQAGAYVEATGGSLSGYLDLFRHRQRDLLSRGKPSTDYPHTVATTWELSFQQVQQASPAGADLLNLCAFLAPDDIPRDLLSEGAGHLPPPLADAVADPLAFNEAVAALRCYSLIEVRDDALSVHRLVQAVTRDRLAGKTQRTWAEAAVRLVNSAFPFESDDVRAWQVCSRLLSHALSTAWHAESLEVDPEAMGHLLNRAGVYFHGRAQFAEAKAALERSLIIAEAVFGPDHPNVASAINNLGRVLKDLGDLVGARAAFDRALTTYEQSLGLEHPYVASVVDNLGQVLQDLGEFGGAHAAYERALVIREQKLGENSPDVATTLSNLGRLLLQQGDPTEGLLCVERALMIYEQAFGQQHPRVATCLNNLGGILHNLGDLERARAAYERALAIDEAAFGPDHPNVATCVNNLGGVLRDLGDLAGAREAFERALAIDEAAFGPDHPNVARDVNNLGSVLKDLGDLVGARAAYKRALAIDQAAFGPDHPKVATDVNNLGNVLQDLGDLVGARAHYERALAIDEAVFGPDHPEVATNVNNLGNVLRDLGDLTGARAACERALRIFRESLGEDHPSTVTVQSNLDSLKALGKTP